MKVIMKNLNTWEAIKALYEGKKIRRDNWKKGDYVKLNNLGFIVDKNNNICPIEIIRVYNKWEVIE